MRTMSTAAAIAVLISLTASTMMTVNGQPPHAEGAAQSNSAFARLISELGGVDDGEPCCSIMCPDGSSCEVPSGCAGCLCMCLYGTFDEATCRCLSFIHIPEPPGTNDVGPVDPLDEGEGLTDQ